MTDLPERLRVRAIEMAAERAALPLLDGTLLLQEILGPDGNAETLRTILVRLRGRRQGVQLVEVCYREDDPQRWADYLRHQARRGLLSGGQQVGVAEQSKIEEEVEHFCARLPQWWSSDDPRSSVDQVLNEALTLPVASIEPRDRQRWRLILLRRVLSHLLRDDC